MSRSNKCLMSVLKSAMYRIQWMAVEMKSDCGHSQVYNHQLRVSEPSLMLFNIDKWAEQPGTWWSQRTKSAIELTVLNVFFKMPLVV